MTNKNPKQVIWGFLFLGDCPLFFLIDVWRWLGGVIEADWEVWCARLDGFAIISEPDGHLLFLCNILL